MKNLDKILKQAWSKETCYPSLQSQWKNNSPLGQCAVTALIVQDYLGGQLSFSKEKNHYWNILPDGSHVDYTSLQFKDEDLLFTFLIESRDFEIVNRSVLFDESHQKRSRTIQRYELLKQQVLELI